MAERKVVSLEEVLEKTPLAEKDVDVSRWLGEGNVIPMRQVDAESMFEWAQENENPELMKHAGLRIMLRSLVKPDGSLYTEEERQHLHMRLRKHGAELVRYLSNESADLNGVSKKAQEERKNGSGGAPTDASPTDSPAS
jgi:hypothetical protein